ncbi:MAG: GNAT family N-acetyltransferase [Chloroflexota bacterium]|nr:GNAT family N-acetyltransferase [Chloroflexota bacterium]
MKVAELTPPSRLSADHDVAAFGCGTPSLDDWLKRQALRNEASGASRTYVVTVERQVVGYYCLSTGAFARSASPKPMQRNMPDPVPVVVLGRLAVDRTYHGQGIGSALLRDSVYRVLGAAESIGIKAMLVHAISDDAKRFYLAKGFLESPVNPMTLCLLLDTARKTPGS